MSTHELFKQALLRMLRDGTFLEMAECPPGRCAQVEFDLRRIYHVHITKHYLVLHERDVEVIRRTRRGRWTALRPRTIPGERIIVDRATGQILDAPHLGKRQRVKV